MGPEILLWRYPRNNIVNGSVLRVASNQFCVFKVSGAILDVYETGLHRVRIPDYPPFSWGQLTFNDEPIPPECEALYINRAQLVIKTRGVAYTSDRARVAYHGDYSVHVTMCKDAAQLAQCMPYWSLPLDTRVLNAYAGPVIEQAVNKLLQVIPLLQVQDLREELSQLVQRPLQEFLSGYGMTLDEVNVQFTPYDEHIKALFWFPAFVPSE